VWQVLPMISNLGYRPLSDRDVQVDLGELEKGQPRSLLVELLVGPRPAGSYRLAQAEVSYDVPGLKLTGEKVKADILIEFTADTVKAKVYDADVMNIVEKVTAFKLQTRALEEAKMGNVAGASQKLRAAATRLLEMGEDELAKSALEEAENLEKSGQMSARGTKKLRYETRKLTQRLSP
jgi:Ca-activated chloride channel family protein